jgi:hypothetical protein
MEIQWARKRYIVNFAVFKINVVDDTEDILNWGFH